MARITHGDVGDTWTPQATFTVGGTPTDPTTITVKVRNAAGTISTIGPVDGSTGGSGIVRVSAGVFNTVIPITASGYWAANFTGTGTAAASEDHEFIADPSPFSSDYGLSSRALVSVAETKDWLQSQNINTYEDLDLVRVINDISERAHDEAEREFKTTATNPHARTFQMTNYSLTRHAIHVGDVAAVTLVEILDDDWTTVIETVDAADWSLQPMVKKAWEPYRRIEFQRDVTSFRAGMRVRVTGTWGFPSVPGNVRQAVLDGIAAVMDRDVEHYRQDLGGQTQQAGETGGTVILVGGGRQRFVSLPPASLAVLWNYRDPVVA